MRADGALGSTGGSALDYDPGMRKAGLFVPVLFALVVDGLACNEPEPEPENLPGEFGEACTPGALEGEPEGCVAGAKCYQGYCEETCTDDPDCLAIEGWDHTCVAGLCQIWCDANDLCPQDLGVTLVCGVVGSSRWCEAVDS